MITIGRTLWRVHLNLFQEDHEVWRQDTASAMKLWVVPIKDKQILLVLLHIRWGSCLNPALLIRIQRY